MGDVAPGVGLCPAGVIGCGNPGTGDRCPLDAVLAVTSLQGTDVVMRRADGSAQVVVFGNPGDEAAVLAENDARQQVQRRVGAHQRRTPFIIQRTLDIAPNGRKRVLLGGDEVEVVSFAGVDDPRLDTAPEQDTVVGRLTTTARVERGPV